MENTIRIKVNAAYNNGISLFNNREMVADPMIFSGRHDPNIKVVVLRIATNSKDADQLYNALQSADNIELNLENVKLES